MEAVSLAIDGMSCGHCVSAVQQALAAVPGVDVQEVRIGTATVVLDPAVTDVDDVIDAIGDAGYQAHRAPE